MPTYLDPTEYADFEKITAARLAGSHTAWKNIQPRDRLRITSGLTLYASAFTRLGYAVEMNIAADKSAAEIYIRFADPTQVTLEDIELLEGAVFAMRIKLGWGGPG